LPRNIRFLVLLAKTEPEKATIPPTTNIMPHSRKVNLEINKDVSKDCEKPKTKTKTAMRIILMLHMTRLAFNSHMATFFSAFEFMS